MNGYSSSCSCSVFFSRARVRVFLLAVYHEIKIHVNILNTEYRQQTEENKHRGQTGVLTDFRKGQLLAKKSRRRRGREDVDNTQEKAEAKEGEDKSQCCHPRSCLLPCAVTDWIESQLLSFHSLQLTTPSLLLSNFFQFLFSPPFISTEKERKLLSKTKSYNYYLFL